MCVSLLARTSNLVKRHNYYNCKYVHVIVHLVCAGGMVGSIMWNDHTNMLAAVADGKLAVWYHPVVAFTNKDLIAKTAVRHKDK